MTHQTPQDYFAQFSGEDASTDLSLPIDKKYIGKQIVITVEIPQNSIEIDRDWLENQPQ